MQDIGRYKLRHRSLALKSHHSVLPLCLLLTEYRCFIILALGIVWDAVL